MDPDDLRFDEPETIVGLTARIRAEFDESPGLRLTELQLRHLFSLESETCSAILATLVGEGFLERDRSGLYLRAK